MTRFQLVVLELPGGQPSTRRSTQHSARLWG
ncbi:hypothetical protein VP199E371_P0049 [Vibrio phage 199E37-1]|nr:hypothetical protein VP199E371_P0049 [Vibrio phage 199E37-1]